MYGATGRSPASLARRYVMDEMKDVWAQHTDSKVAEEGNPELLEYRALKWFPNGFAIANGRQIELVRNPGFAQEELMKVEPEPDKYLTPRITGVVSSDGVVLYMARSVGGKTESKCWPLELEEGIGYFVSTYTGEDVRPTQSFSGDPVKLELSCSSVKDVTKAVFDSLAPTEGQDDYRVGVVGVMMRSVTDREVAIYNKL